MSKSDEKLREELKVAGKPKPKRNSKPAKNASTDTTGEAKAPRPKIAPGSTPSQVLQAHLPDTTALYAACRIGKSDEVNKHTFNALAKRIDGTLAKKVGEKAVNLLRNRSNPDGVQVYTRIAMDHLIAQGTMTSASLKGVYAGKYKKGTCDAQSNQIMQLFPALGVADRSEDKSTLTLNKDSAIVQDYRKAMK